jgi:hypothetical protein
MARIFDAYFGDGGGNRLRPLKRVVLVQAPSKEKRMPEAKSVLPPEDDCPFEGPSKAKSTLPELRSSVAEVTVKRKGGRPKSEKSLSQQKPWEAEGVSRASWYESRKKSKGEV